MRWTLFTKLFFVGYLAVIQDNRLPELAMCHMLTCLSTFVTARTCKRIIEERERLKPCGFADIYILLYIDIIYQWSAALSTFNKATSKIEEENSIERNKDKKD